MRCLAFALFMSTIATTQAFAGDGITAQAPAPAQNALYVELGGNGAFYSINYERYLRPDMAVRVGGSFMSIDASAGSAESKSSWLTIPLMFEYLGVASGPHALELGGGVDLMWFSGTASTFDATAMDKGVIPVGTATLGYRYSAPDGGFVFRAGYTPLFFVTTSTKQVFHWGGMSFGYRF